MHIRSSDLSTSALDAWSHKAILLRLALGGFLGGVALASFFIVPAWVGWLVAGIGAIACLVRHPISWAGGLACIAIALGIWRTDAATGQMSVLRDIAADMPTVTLAGFVDGDFELTARGGKFPFRVLPENERIVVYTHDWVRPRYGQALTLTGKLQQPKNTGTFDYISYLAKDGIVAQMYFPEYGVPVSEVPMPFAVRLKQPLIAVRDALGDAITRAVPQPEAGYLRGILLGVRGDISADLKEAFSRTGTSHILAISGYNITIVAGVLMTLLARLGRSRSYWLMVAGVVAFTLMVGASPSVVRAALMGILALTAVHLGRRANADTAILVSAAAMAAFNPLLVRWDVGFQLSFLAVVGIVYLEPLVRAPLKRLTVEPLAAMAATTFAAQIMVLPLILYDFGTLAVYTLPVNLLVLPLVPLAMALGFATGAAGLLIPFLGAIIGQLAWLVAAVELTIIRFAAALPYAALDVPISAAALVAAYVGLAAYLISVYSRNPELPPIWQNEHSSS